MTKKMTTVMVVLALLVNSGTAFAQEATIQPVKVEKRMFSMPLVITGLTTMLVGAALMVPMEDPGATSYYIEGAGSYCVTNNTTRQSVSVAKGGCDDLPAMMTAGWITLGVGGALTLIGLHRVSVSSHVGHSVVGGKVSVKW